MAASIVYKWKRGARQRIKAQDAGEELARLAKANGGRVQPQQVVDASESEDAPLHNAFDWDDASAANAHRCQQARQLICQVQLVSRDPATKEKRPTVAFVSTVEDDERGYSPIARVMSSEEIHQGVCDEALAQLNGWKQRYQGLAVEWPNLFNAIEDAMAARKAPKPKRRQPAISGAQ